MGVGEVFRCAAAGYIVLRAVYADSLCHGSAGLVEEPVVGMWGFLSGHEGESHRDSVPLSDLYKYNKCFAEESWGKGLVRIRGVGVFLKGGMGTSYHLIPYQPSMPPLFRRTHMPKGYGYGKKKPLKRKPAKGGKKK